MTAASGGPATGYALNLSDDEVQRYRLMAEAARTAEADQWQLAGIRPGAVVADVGCGPGAMLPALAEAVGPLGRVIAVDGEDQTVAQAEALVAAAGLTNVSVHAARADDTRIEAGSCDAVMMRHVLAHNGGSEQAIVDHLAGLLRPAGSVYLVDIFAAGMRMRSSDPDLDDMFDKYRIFHAARGNPLDVGLHLDELLAGASLDVLDFRGRYEIVELPPGVRGPVWAAREAMIAAGVVTADDVARWEQALQRMEPRRPTMFATVFSAVGRRRP